MVIAKEKQQARLFRTRAIYIYEDEDKGDVCFKIIHWCQKLSREMRHDRRKRRTLFFSGMPLLLLMIILLATTQTALMNNDLGFQSAPMVVEDESYQSQYNLTTDVKLPKSFDRTIANLNEPFEKGRDVPLFFHIPRSAGSTLKDMMGRCLQMRIAWNSTSTLEGLKQAKDARLVQKGELEVVTTQYLFEAAKLFNGRQHRGRCFVFMRHPIERVVSLFYYLGSSDARHEPTYDPRLKFISIEMWARSKAIPHNWITRFLSNELVGDLTPRHLERAKAVLRQKCLVGLLDEKTESWSRFQTFFGWHLYTEEMRECQDELLNWHWSGKHMHPLIEDGSAAWELLYKQNMFDMELYNYARQLFVEQRLLFQSE